MSSETDKVKARKWFDRAKTVADARNYDYAIEAYISGLKIWPDGVEEGHKKLRAVAIMRQQSGGKAMGFLAQRKYPISTKDPLAGMFNAEHRWAHEPTNVDHMVGMVECASLCGCHEAGVWMGNIAADTLASQKKPSLKQLATMCEATDRIGETAQKESKYDIAVGAYEIMVRVARAWVQFQNNQESSKMLANATSKLTIVRGRFDQKDGFADSIKDREAQKAQHDQDRLITSSDRADELIAKSKAEFENDRGSAQKLTAYITMLSRRELDADENEAIEVLKQVWQESKNYSHKAKADDIRLKQLRRHVRDVAGRFAANRTDETIRQEAIRMKKAMLDAEIEVFQERAKEYPTDLRVRFQLAEALFKSKRYDDAIPLYQQAQADGRSREASRLAIGKCFFEKNLYSEAISSLQRATQEHDMGGNDEVGREMHYYLALSYENAERRQEAMDVYGQLIQWDYNYKDARQRLEKLRGLGENL